MATIWVSYVGCAFKHFDMSPTMTIAGARDGNGNVKPTIVVNEM